MKFCNIFFSKNVPHTPVISLSKVTIVSGHMINLFIKYILCGLYT